MHITNGSIARQQVASAVEAVLLTPGAADLHGYATLTGTKDSPEIEVFTFPTRAAMDNALSARFTGRTLEQIYQDVYVFSPDKPVRLKVVLEDELVELDIPGEPAGALYVVNMTDEEREALLSGEAVL